jgi:hypothetical protein
MRIRLLPILAVVVLAGPAFGATVKIINVNAPGVGFNDPTPAVPVGGNFGSTVGQQRLNAFQFAADHWAARLDSSVEIRVRGSFEPLTCTATSAVLGSAGPRFVFRDFPGALRPLTWYHVALADKLAMTDFVAGIPDDHITARFNSNLGNVGCLTGVGWYYGFDTNHGTQINLVTVLLHEFAHGLGFSSTTNVTTGAWLGGFTDAYSSYYFDDTTGKFRDQMTQAERAASAINPRNVVWTGPRVTANVPGALAPGTPLLRVSSPASVAGSYQVGAAAFGPHLASPGISGNVVIAIDPANAAGPTTTDACSPITNSATVAGRIALVDRGTCGFIVKVKNAQDAGAIAVIVADNVAGGPPAGLGGADPTITIPSVRITLADGNAIKTALAGGSVAATLGVDLTVRAGADATGRALLYTPNPVAPGSTVSHWDTSAFPNQLMEPSINSDLAITVSAPRDLTRSLLRDVGWFPDADLDAVADDEGDQCLGSDLAATVIIGGEDTGVSNTFFVNGCSVRDFIRNCQTGAKNHGAYASCAAQTGNALVAAGIITGAEKGAIQRAVAHDE